MIEIYGLQTFLSAAALAHAEQKNLQIVGGSSSFIQLAALVLSENRRLVVVLPNEKELDRWSHILSHNPHLVGQDDLRIHLLPSLSRWGYDRFVNAEITKIQRLATLTHFCLDRRGPEMILTTISGLAQKTLPNKEFRKLMLHLKIGDEITIDDLTQKCRDLGYLLSEEVTEESSFAVRGGIFDIFSPHAALPARIEFWGDTIKSLRSFHPAKQKSLHALEEIYLTPASEIPIHDDNRKESAQRLHDFFFDQDFAQADKDAMINAVLNQNFFREKELFGPIIRKSSESGWDYIGKDDLLLYPEGIVTSEKSFKEFADLNQQHYESDVAQKRATTNPDIHFLPDNPTRARPYIEFGNPFVEPENISARYNARNTLREAPAADERDSSVLFDKWVDVIEPLMRNESAKIVMLCAGEEQKSRLEAMLRAHKLATKTHKNIFPLIFQDKLSKAEVTIGLGSISSHLWLEETETLIISDSALFGRSKPKRQKDSNKKLQNYLKSFRDLKVGDYIVHLMHGIGKYQGMVNMSFENYQADFIWLEYHGGDKIYLPVDRLNLLQKYSGSDGESVTLDRLGTTSWAERKQKIKQKVLEIAADLLKIHAQRKIAKAYRYPSLDEEYFKFEAAFPFTETDDQLKAISDIHADMESMEAMDRLVCGDVGFGKTEVAMRGAFRAAREGRQVLVLVPTTVLCFQHFRTFQARMHNFGINIGQVNRFVSNKEVKENLDMLEHGKLDILIGTHRLLSTDIKPKNLGLLIIDEEQRFGVTHKEKLKRLRVNTDVLTLSATPIPRTLQMAMLGLRDISLITTAPPDRLPVRTYVSEFDELLIKQALQREMDRGGQAFFVHNRVQDIEETCAFVRSLIPGHEVRYAHGQMNEHQLEKVVVDFIEQKFPVMVCTTIIESGVDMPNVNTMIVNRADHFGLSQLYQLRGRVGRSKRQAFALFMTPKPESLSDDAIKRLNVISTHQDLGAGFQIASHDLEIRGAGNLLGAQQSGQVKQVGLELYTQMLDAAIAELRNTPETIPDDLDVEISLPVTTIIPDRYIQSESRRLEFYKDLFAQREEEDIAALRNKTKDLYGPVPWEVELLFELAILKQILRRSGVSSLKFKPTSTLIAKFSSLSEAQLDKIINATLKNQDTFKLTPDFKLIMRLPIQQPKDLRSQEIFVKEIARIMKSLELNIPMIESKN